MIRRLVAAEHDLGRRLFSSELFRDRLDRAHVPDVAAKGVDVCRITREITRQFGRAFIRDETAVEGPLAVRGLRQPMRIGAAAYGLAVEEQWATETRGVDFFDVEDNTIIEDILQVTGDEPIKGQARPPLAGGIDQDHLRRRSIEIERDARLAFAIARDRFTQLFPVFRQ